MRRPAMGSVAVLVIAIAAALLVAVPAGAEKPSRQQGWSSAPSSGPSHGRPPGPPPGGHNDYGRHYPPPGGHNYYGRYYPPPGYVVRAPPPGYHVAHHHHDRYYYGAGAWYRPYGSYYRVIVPPVGIVVPFLPNFYTTLWFGGLPYYYANSVYYVGRSDGPGYVVTNPPYGASSSAAAASEEFFVYPKAGQSEEAQARDRYDCHRWAVDQTGFDPSLPGGGVPDADNLQARSEYRRAITACLEALDYTVR